MAFAFLCTEEAAGAAKSVDGRAPFLSPAGRGWPAGPGEGHAAVEIIQKPPGFADPSLPAGTSPRWGEEGGFAAAPSHKSDNTRRRLRGSDPGSGEGRDFGGLPS